MSKKTRILALALVIVMLVGIMPLSLFAEEEAAAVAEETSDVSVLDQLAAKATGSLFGGITIPSGATAYYDKNYAYQIGSGSEKENGIYVDSGWGDGSKSLIDTVDNLTGGTVDDTNTNITFNIIPTTSGGVFKDQRYFVSSFNIKVGEAYNYTNVYRLRIRYAYKVTTTYDADGNQVGDPVKASAESQYQFYPVSYSASTKQLTIPAGANDTGKAIPLGTWSSETYTNFGLIIDFEEDKAYYYLNGILVATKSELLGVTKSEPDADGNYTVTTFDFSKATLGLNPMFNTNNPYCGEYAQYGKTTAYFTTDTAHVFDSEGNFLQENKTPANGVFKFRDNYYLYKNGMLVTDKTATVEGYTLEIDSWSGRITNVYRQVRESYKTMTKDELLAKGASNYGTTSITKLSSATFAATDGSGKLTAYRYAEDGETVETYQIDAVRNVDYAGGKYIDLLGLTQPTQLEQTTYYASEADLKAGKLTTITKQDMQVFYGNMGTMKKIVDTGGSSRDVRADETASFVFSFDAIGGEALFNIKESNKALTSIPFLRIRTYYEYLKDEVSYYYREDLSLISIKIVDGTPKIFFGNENCGELSLTEKTNFTLFFKMDEQVGPLLSLYVNGELKNSDVQFALAKGAAYKEGIITGHHLATIGTYYSSGMSFSGRLFSYYPAKYYDANENYEAVTAGYTGIEDDGFDFIYYENGAIAARGDAATVEAAAGKKYAELEGYNVALADTIHMNFYAKLGSVANEAGAYALLTVGGEEQKVMLNTLEPAANGTYKITAKVSSIQMDKGVSLKFFDGEGTQLDIQKNGTVSDEYSYSVKQYAEYIIANQANYTAEALNVVKAMLLYGAFAERHFTSEVDLSNARVISNFERLAVQYGKVGLFYTNISIVSNIFKYTVNDHTEEVDLTATATDTSKLGQVYLVLDSAIKIRIELNVTEAPVAVSGGVLHTETVEGVTKYFVDITDLTAKDLNTVNTVIVDENVINVTALAAANAVVSAGAGTYGKTFTDLMNAMYLYYYYADAYVKSIA